MPLRGDLQRLIIRTRRHPHHPEWLPLQPFLYISDGNDVPRREANPLHCRLKIDKRVSVDGLVQLQRQRPRRLIEIRQPQRLIRRRHLPVRQQRVIDIHQRQTILLILVELVLKFHRQPVRSRRRIFRPQPDRRCAVRAPRQPRERSRPVAELVRRPPAVQLLCAIASIRQRRLLQRERILHAQRQQSPASVRQHQRRRFANPVPDLSRAVRILNHQVASEFRRGYRIAVQIRTSRSPSRSTPPPTRNWSGRSQT